MNKIVTYFYLESKESSSKYGVLEEDYFKKNEYYFRCIVNFFISSLKYNSNCEHYFIINEIENLNFIKNFDLDNFFRENKIKLIEKKSKYVKFEKTWAGSVYIFDAMEHFLEEEKIEDEDNYIFFDNDMFFNSNLEKSLDKVGNFNYLVYDISHEFRRNKEGSADFNGLDLISFDKDFKLCGGEFLGIKGKAISNFLDLFKKLNKNNIHNFSTEEHYISYIISYELDKKSNIKYANAILKRCWTTLKFRNVKEEDYKKDILHIPSEKEFGIYWYNKKVNSVEQYNSFDIMRYCGILNRPLYLKIKLFMKKIKVKIIKIFK